MKTKFIKILSLVLTILVLTAATALSLVSCVSDKPSLSPLTKGTAEVMKTITVEIVTDKGESIVYEIKTTCDTLRGALEQEDLVKGDESEYGLYVKEVAGIVADYDIDRAYWGFYKGGEYLMSGIDTTMIADGDHYEIVYTK